MWRQLEDPFMIHTFKAMDDELVKGTKRSHLMSAGGVDLSNKGALGTIAIISNIFFNYFKNNKLHN